MLGFGVRWLDTAFLALPQPARPLALERILEPGWTGFAHGLNLVSTGYAPRLCHRLHLRHRAHNNTGASDWSNEATVTTPPAR